ncbi:OLC1v1021344C1 [Oldenlandia corymbosa var. corymbosa]|uniref:OLC1v1021344C1 n=1 Tax=Oldenlandia corymbosa var. corymbosa TaxID=529605 RepID=A0AAV1BW32_OLDCO|nr:OLC1v1021344C1 [Oldenlandia corymbosa var. corymbosa]
MDKTFSWFENVLDKFDNFSSDINDIINQVPFEYAENQLLKAGANVKQFCSEFVEEMLPETIINTLKEKPSPSVAEQMRTDINEEPTKAPSDDSSPFPMDIIENEHYDSPFETGTNIGKDLCFEELRIRDIEVSQVEAYNHDGECHENLPQSSSSNPPAKLLQLGELLDRHSADPKVELSTVTSPSSMFAGVGELSDTADEKISDVKKEHPAVPLDNSKVTPGCNVNLYPENQGIPLGHEVRTGSSDSNGESDVIKAKEIEDNHDVKATELIEDKCTMLDTRKLCLAPDLIEETFICQVFFWWGIIMWYPRVMCNFTPRVEPYVLFTCLLAKSEV